MRPVTCIRRGAGSTIARACTAPVHRPRRTRTLVLLALAVLAVTPRPVATQLSGQEKRRVRNMIDQIHEDIRDQYFDPDYRGVDLDSSYQATRAQAQEVPNLGAAFLAMAQFTGQFTDSHTAFLPPGNVYRYDYGFDVGLIGDSVYVTEVTEGGGAERIGMEPGDRVAQVGPYAVTRGGLPTLLYIYYALAPRKSMNVGFVKRDGRRVDEVLQATVTEGPYNLDPDNPNVVRWLRERARVEARDWVHVYNALSDEVFLWKLPSFELGDRRLIDDMVERARHYPAMVLDLRGNPGGVIRTLLHLVGAFFEDDVKVGDTHTRDGHEEIVARPTRRDGYPGELIVLVDGLSASSAEIFARTMQLEGRALVMGDRTAGMVMSSKLNVHTAGNARAWSYALQVAVSDWVMTDGGKLEGVGVVPDRIVLPTPEDLREERDPVLAAALATLGIGIDPVDAARLLKLRNP